MAFVFVMSYWLFTAKFIMNLFDQKAYVVLSSIIIQTILLHVVYHGTFLTGYIWLNDFILQGIINIYSTFCKSEKKMLNITITLNII